LAGLPITCGGREGAQGCFSCRGLLLRPQPRLLVGILAGTAEPGGVHRQRRWFPAEMKELVPNTSNSGEDALRRLEDFYSSNADNIRKVIRLRLGTALRRRLDTDDVLQETALKAARILTGAKSLRFDCNCSFWAWLTQVIHYTVNSLERYYLRSKRGILREKLIDPYKHDEVASKRTRTPSDLLSSEEMYEKICNSLNKLSPREREVVILVHFRNLRVREASRRLGKTPNSTSVLLHQALGKLSKYIDQETI